MIIKLNSTGSYHQISTKTSNNPDKKRGNSILILYGKYKWQLTGSRVKKKNQTLKVAVPKAVMVCTDLKQTLRLL